MSIVSTYDKNYFLASLGLTKNLNESLQGNFKQIQ